MKIEVSNVEHALIVAALYAYVPNCYDVEKLANRIGIIDTAEDGPEVAILSMDRQS